MATLTDEQLDEINARRKKKGKRPLSRKQADAMTEADGDDLDTTELLTVVFPGPDDVPPPRAVDAAYIDRRGSVPDPTPAPSQAYEPFTPAPSQAYEPPAPSPSPSFDSSPSPSVDSGGFSGGGE